MFDATVLLIDDERHVRRAVRRLALLNAAHVFEASTARDGLDLAAATAPDLVILDLQLPDGDGFELCRELRRWFVGPIMVVTARHADRDKVRALDGGADDFVAKPFNPDELAARMRVQLRRAAGRAALAPDTIQHIDHLHIDIPGRSLWRTDRDGDEMVRLTRTEWNLLDALIANADRTLTHASLHKLLWDEPRGPHHHIRMHVANLRRKIERDPVAPRLIITESGIGYRFQRPL